MTTHSDMTVTLSLSNDHKALAQEIAEAVDPSALATRRSCSGAAAPDATILVLTYDTLQLPRSPRLLLSNSPIRLRADIAAVAEAVS